MLSFNRLFVLFFALFFALAFSSAASAELKVAFPSASDTFVLKQTSGDMLGTHDQGVGIKKGEKVPPFSATTHDGAKIDFARLLNKAPLMVVFYRGGWCPFCNLQIRELTKKWPEFSKRGVTPVVISADSVDGAALASKAYEIPFPVISDPELSAHNAFDVVLDVDDTTYKMFQSYGIELEDWSGKDHHKIAVASAFLVNKDGKVQWAHTSNDYETRPSAQQLLAIIDQLK